MASDSETFLVNAKFNFIHHPVHVGKTAKSKTSDVEWLYVTGKYKPDVGRYVRWDLSFNPGSVSN